MSSCVEEVIQTVVLVFVAAETTRCVSLCLVVSCCSSLIIYFLLFKLHIIIDQSVDQLKLLQQSTNTSV